MARFSIVDLKCLADRESVLPDGTKSMIFKSGNQSVRIRIKNQWVQMDLFKGSKHVKSYGGCEESTWEYFCLFIKGFLSCQQE